MELSRIATDDLLWVRILPRVPILMEGCLTWDVSTALKAVGAERPRVRFCYPSSILKRIEAQFDCYRNAAVSGR